MQLHAHQYATSHTLINKQIYTAQVTKEWGRDVGVVLRTHISQAICILHPNFATLYITSRNTLQVTKEWGRDVGVVVAAQREWLIMHPTGT